jgi:hypothetical protein
MDPRITQYKYAEMPNLVGVPARVIRFRRNSTQIELSFTPPAHWLPKIQSGAREFEAIIHLPTGVNILARLHLHRPTPKGTTYLFYVKRPASEAIASTTEHNRLVIVLDLWPRAEERPRKPTVKNTGPTTAAP